MTLIKPAPRIDLKEDDADVVFEDQAELGRYVLLLWRWLPLIAGVGLACGALASLVALRRPTQYEATSTLAVSGSKAVHREQLRRRGRGQGVSPR
jgi:uncharacterized protein involved in exopolysaccharide biosynthesis